MQFITETFTDWQTMKEVEEKFIAALIQSRLVDTIVSLQFTLCNLDDEAYCYESL